MRMNKSEKYYAADRAWELCGEEAVFDNDISEEAARIRKSVIQIRLLPDSYLQDFFNNERGWYNGYKKTTAVYDAVSYAKTTFEKRID